MVAQVCNPSDKETETDISLGLTGQPPIQSATRDPKSQKNKIQSGQYLRNNTQALYAHTLMHHNTPKHTPTHVESYMYVHMPSNPYVPSHTHSHHVCSLEPFFTTAIAFIQAHCLEVFINGTEWKVLVRGGIFCIECRNKEVNL